MKEYKRLQYNLDILEKHNEIHTPVFHLTDGKTHEQDLVRELIADCRELLNKIENGTLIESKYPLYSTVFIVDYVNEKGYSVGVGVGKPIVRECFITTISQVMKSQILYRVQPKDLPQEVIDGKVEHIEHWEIYCYQEKQLFLTKAEAEKKLKELQNDPT